MNLASHMCEYWSCLLAIILNQPPDRHELISIPMQATRDFKYIENQSVLYNVHTQLGANIEKTWTPLKCTWGTMQYYV